MRDTVSFKKFITEAKEVIDLRHRDFRDELDIDPLVKKDKYINPSDGFYWTYYDAVLILSSHENRHISSFLKYAQQHNQIPRKVYDSPGIKTQEIGKAWNSLSGMVNFSSKTILVDKEYAGDKPRQRTVANVKEFKQAIQSLQKYKVTSDFKLKGVPPHIPKTVKDVLKLRDSLDLLLDIKQTSVMFHGTSEKRWEMIKRRGLIPRVLDPNRNDKDDVYVDLIPDYSEHNVYVTTNKKTADFYAKRQAQKDDSYPIVLRVEIPDKNNLIPDDRFVNKKTQAYDFTAFKKSVYELGELAYKGVILPKFIKPA